MNSRRCKPELLMSYALSFRVFVVLATTVLAAYSQEAAPAAAALSVSGDISSPLALKAADLAKMPRQTVIIQEHDGTKAEYEGVPLLEILRKAGAPIDKQLRGKTLSGYLLAKAHDGYQVLFSLGEIAPEFGNTPLIVADMRGSKPLSGELGPLRLVCPNDKAAARSVRMLDALEIVRLRK
jgi:DMSO/TMAO reductase YedYZ molybdopterin-dependent catalytic subunit